MRFDPALPDRPDIGHEAGERQCDRPPRSATPDSPLPPQYAEAVVTGARRTSTRPSRTEAITGYCPSSTS